MTPHLLVTAAVTALVGLGPASASASAPAAAPTCDGLRATIVGTSGDDTLRGTSGNDVIWAGPGDDTVRGGPGDDVVCGGRGADLLVGGAGADRLYGGQDGSGFDRGGAYLVGDVLHGGAGDDLLDVGVDDRDPGDGTGLNTVSYAAAAGPVSVDLGGSRGSATGEGSDTVVLRPRLEVDGSAYDDTLRGSAGDDVLYGGPGSDHLEGLAGDDTLEGQSPTYAAGERGDDTIDGGAGADFVRSFEGRATLSGGADDDQVVSYSPDAASVSGGSGDDDLVLGLSHDPGYAADGGAGDDSLSLLRDDVDETTSTPTDRTPPLGRLDLTAGTVSVAWDPGPAAGAVTGVEHVTLDDWLPWDVVGTSGDDDVTAGYYYRLHAWMRAGDDTVTGSGAADTVHGGAGVDTVDGREGRDVCVDVEHAYSCS